MTFAGDLGADSLELFQIVMGVEGEFDIIIQDGDAENIKTVGDLFQVISDVR